MLKLISWNDWPENRSQDLDDIYLIFGNIFVGNKKSSFSKTLTKLRLSGSE